MESCGRRVAVIFFLLVAATARNVPMKDGRSLKEENDGTKASNSSEVLKASDQTIRIDPLDSFHKYRGGFNITNKHYWSSVIFTGIHGYTIAVLWLLGGVIYGGFLITESCCCTRKKDADKEVKKFHCTRKCYIWSLAIVLLTILAIVASGIALAGSSRFHSRANAARRIISDVADTAVESIYNVTAAVKAIQDNTERYGVTILKTSAQLNSTSHKLREGAYLIRDKAYKNVKVIGKGLKALHTTNVVLVSLNAFLLLSLLCLGFLKLRQPFRVFLVICWMLGFFLWLFFGLYFFLERFAGDTCVALEGYQQQPGNSSLSSILPCGNQLSAKSALRDTRKGIYTLINQVNANLSASPIVLSATNLGLICNPFSNPPEYQYQPQICQKNTTKIGDIPSVLKKFACIGSNCDDGEFIPAVDYAAVSSFSASIQQLIDALPGAERLVSCQLVQDAFSEIHSHHCGSLKRNVKVTWATMAALAATTTLLVAAWAAMDRHHTKHHSFGGSIRPHVMGKENQVVTNHIELKRSEGT